MNFKPRLIALRMVFVLVVFATFITTGSAQNQNQSSKVQTGKAPSAYSKGMAYQARLEFDSAISSYQQFKQSLTASAGDKIKLREVDKRVLECESGKKLVNNPREFHVLNLGSKINSTSEDYAPVLSEDEDLLVFTSRRPEGNINSKRSDGGKYTEDIFISHKVNGDWSAAENIGPPVNTPSHDSDLALSADGKRLFVYSDANEGDILVSDNLNGKWTQPKALPFPINTPYHESSVSTDGKRFFVASERPGGKGGSDIWLVEKNQAGLWKSSNLGSLVNTPWDEDSPFIDYDGKTLYFSSTGHDSMGGFDIFRTQKESGVWSPAENIGYPINTPGHDSYFVSTKDGRRAYYSSVQPGGMGEEDLYQILLPDELRRREVLPNSVRQEGDTVRVPSPKRIAVIYFSFQSAELPASARPELDSLVQKISKSKAYTLLVFGHTDNIGSSEFNQKLSFDRAIAVKSYLESQGVSKDRIEIWGMGLEMPVESNLTDTGRQRNRRVEIRIQN